MGVRRHDAGGGREPAVWSKSRIKLRDRSVNLISRQSLTDYASGKWQDLFGLDSGRICEPLTTLQSHFFTLRTGAGIGIPRIDEKIAGIGSGKVLARDLNRSGTERISGKYAGEGGLFRNFNQHKIEAVLIANAAGKRRQLYP